MRSLMEAVENTMPGYVVDELHKKGFWRLSSDGYLLGNGKSNNDITLRLDFSFSRDKLVQYISKEYGFVDSMPDDRINKNQAKELVAEFERAFLSRKVNKNNIEIYNGYNTYKEKDYAAFIDEYGNTFLVHLLKNMVIKYDAGEKLLEPGQKQSREFYFEDIDVTIKLPENENWILQKQKLNWILGKSHKRILKNGLVLFLMKMNIGLSSEVKKNLSKSSFINFIKEKL